MKNQLFRISLKFGFILAACHVLLSLISPFTFDPDSTAFPVLLTVLNWSLFILFVALAHYEFNKKNGNYISFRDAIFIGLLVIGISFVISTVHGFITFRYLLNDRMEEMYSNLRQQYGVDETFFLTQVITSAVTNAVVQLIVLFLIITVESQWKIFKKAGREGWASIVPVYNTIVLLDIVGKPTWWIILLLIPFVNVIFAVWVVNLLAQRFGKSEGFTFGLLVLPFIFYPMLGLSKEQYHPE